MKPYEIALENYINGEYSVCREERQYALFLYNVLRRYHDLKSRKGNDDVEKIISACGIPVKAEIEYVFYEATFMRDFFERNRRIKLSPKCDRPQKPENTALNKTFKPSTYEMTDDESFNAKLIEYYKKEINKKSDITFQGTYKGIEHNLGGKSIECDTIIRSMMNSKPDIAVIYALGKEKYLHFIECKFESGEGSDSEDNKQRYIQWKIAEFLCMYYLTDLNVSGGMEDENSCLVQFVRKKPAADNEIYIAKLIELNENIFLCK